MYWHGPAAGALAMSAWQRLSASVRMAARSLVDGPVGAGVGVVAGADAGVAGAVLTGALGAGVGVLDGEALALLSGVASLESGTGATGAVWRLAVLWDVPPPQPTRVASANRLTSGAL